jgi:hypothetical protein
LLAKLGVNTLFQVQERPEVTAAEHEEVLSSGKRRFIKVACTVFFVAQFSALPLAAIGRDVWPFSHYAMFAYRAESSPFSVKVTLHQDNGQSFTTLARSVIPMEGFRDNSVMADVYITGKDDETKRALAQLVLDRLNHGGFRGFDERYDSVNPDRGHRFTGLDVVVQYWDAGTPPVLRPPRPVRTETVFTYRDASDSESANR